MKKANNFQIVKVQPQGVVAFAWFFTKSSLVLLIKVLLIEKKRVLQIGAIITNRCTIVGKYVNKPSGLRPATLLKNRLWHRCFPVNFAKFLRIPFLTEHFRWLLLDILIEFKFFDCFPVFVRNLDGTFESQLLRVL